MPIVEALLEAMESRDQNGVKAALRADTVWLAEPGEITGVDKIARHLLTLTLAGHARVTSHGAHVVVRTPEWSAALEVRADGVVVGSQFNS